MKETSYRSALPCTLFTRKSNRRGGRSQLRRRERETSGDTHARARKLAQPCAPLSGRPHEMMIRASVATAARRTVHGDPTNTTVPSVPPHGVCSVVNRFFTVLAAASSLPPLNHNSLPPPPHRGVDLPPVYTQSTPRKQSAIAVYKIYLLGAAAPETPLVFDAASFFSFFSPSLNGRRLRSNTRLRRSFTLRTRTKRRCTAASTQ